MPTNQPCHFCDDSGFVEWDEPDHKGEHTTARARCECNQEDTQSRVDHELDKQAAKPRTYRVSFKGCIYSATVEAECKRQAISLAVLTARGDGFGVRHRAGYAEEV